MNILRSFIAATIPGMGKDTDIDTNSMGGKQSKLNYRFDLVPAEALFEVSKVLADGAKKYGENNWLLVSSSDHTNHALAHIFAYLAGDSQDEHLEHAATRTLMALATSYRERRARQSGQ